MGFSTVRGYRVTFDTLSKGAQEKVLFGLLMLQNVDRLIER